MTPSEMLAWVRATALLVVAWNSICVTGYFFSMISDSQFYVSGPGDTISMECNFHADEYNMFQHPVLWRKQQLNESHDMNILGTIIEPFAATNRFEVTFNSAEPRYQLELSIREPSQGQTANFSTCGNTKSVTWQGDVNITDECMERAVSIENKLQKDLTIEDSGNYTCEVRGANSAILAYVIHYLFVRAPVESVRLFAEPQSPAHTSHPHRSIGSASTSSTAAAAVDRVRHHSLPSVSTNHSVLHQQHRHQQQQQQHQQHLTAPVLHQQHRHQQQQQQHQQHLTAPVARLIENRSAIVRCTAVGGYPPPRLEVTVVTAAANGGNGREVTSLGTVTSLTTTTGIRLVGPKPGFRRLLAVTERSTDDFVPTANEDGARLNCQAIVPGLRHRVGSIGLDVVYSPKITCSASEANIDDINVNIKCDVKAKPRPTNTFWIVTDNGTTVMSGEVTDDFWAVLKDRKDGVVESILYIQRADADKFRRYVIVAENSVDVGRREVELVHKFRTNAKPLSDAASGRVAERVSSRDTGLQQRIDKHAADSSGGSDSNMASQSTSSVRETIRRSHVSNAKNAPVSAAGGASPTVMRRLTIAGVISCSSSSSLLAVVLSLLPRLPSSLSSTLPPLLLLR